MSSQIPRLASFGTFNLCLRPSIRPSQSILPLVQTATLTRWEKKRLAKRDPFRWAQIQQRKNANLERQAQLREERRRDWGTPVSGVPIPTPFVESFDSAGQESRSRYNTDAQGNPLPEPRVLPTSPDLLSHLVSKGELEEAIRDAYTLTKPLAATENDDPAKVEARQQEHETKHAIATEAMKRILSMDNANAKIKRHVNISRCVEEFGRHNTDKVLKPKLPSIHPNPVPMPERSGPDTGSSEVQIAILTSKIRNLAQALEQPGGSRDKHNKRNLRVLCHRRQRLMRYMEKKERGSERWTHMIEKLGLTPATWKEQISI